MPSPAQTHLHTYIHTYIHTYTTHDETRLCAARAGGQQQQPLPNGACKSPGRLPRHQIGLRRRCLCLSLRIAQRPARFHCPCPGLKGRGGRGGGMGVVLVCYTVAVLIQLVAVAVAVAERWWATSRHCLVVTACFEACARFWASTKQEGAHGFSFITSTPTATQAHGHAHTHART